MVFKVLIGSEEYAVSDQYSIQQQGGAVSSSTLDIKVATGQTVPVSMAAVTILSDDVPFFSGIIQNVASPDFNSGKETKRYRLTISSKEVVFNNRLVSEAYVDTLYAHQIIADLFNKYIVEEGVTLGAISNTEFQYTNYNCAFTKLSDVLSEIAGDVNGTYYISADNKFYFFIRSDFEQVPAPEHVTQLRIEEQKGDLRTVQVITGSSEKTSEQIEHATWLANQTTWTLGYAVTKITGFTINGATATYGVLGVDDSDTSRTFLYQIGSNIITVNPSATVKPMTGQIAVCVYTGYYDILCTEINATLQQQIKQLNGTSGKIEAVYTDETLKNFSDADAKAKSLLSQYDEREEIVSCRCHDMPSSEMFKMWYIDKPGLGIVGNYVVTERSISAFGAKDVWIDIKLKNKNFFARYGQTLVKGTKTVSNGAKVYKNYALGERLTVHDKVMLDNGGIVFYPTSGEYNDPMLDGFYPGV